MTLSPVNEGAPDTDDEPTAIVVYPGHFCPCPVCGYVPREFAHLDNGKVMAYHVFRSPIDGTLVGRFCEIQ